MCGNYTYIHIHKNKAAQSEMLTEKKTSFLTLFGAGRQKPGF